MSATLSPLTPLTGWSDRLAFDVALTLEGSGEPLPSVMAQHGLKADDIMRFNKDKIFLKRVEAYRDEIREKGLTFKMKARAQAEELLKTSWVLIHDPGVSPAVKADLIKSTVKWGGLEPKNEVNAEVGGGGVSITINLGNSPKDARVIQADDASYDQSAIEGDYAEDSDGDYGAQD